MPTLGITADSYTIPPSLGFPPSLPGLEAWYDPSNLATITVVSEAVSQLNDLSINDRHLVQTNATYRPGTGTHAINGLNVLKFGAKALVPPNPMGIPQPCTIAMVVGHDGVSGAHRCLGSSGSTLFMGTSAGTSGRCIYGAPTLVSGTSSNETTAGPHIFVAIFDSVGGSSLRVDGIMQITGNPGSNGFDTMFIGANSATGGSGWRETIGEIIMYSNAVSGTDLDGLERYLADKWGIVIP